MLEYSGSSRPGEDENAGVRIMTEKRPARLDDADLDDAAAGLREVLRLARALGKLDDEAQLLDLVNATARDKVGCGACAIAIKGDDGIFRFTAASGLTVKEERALRGLVLTLPAFEALRDSAELVGAVWRIPAGHAVREMPDVIAGLLPDAKAGAVPPRRSRPLLFVPLVAVDGSVLGLLHPIDPKGEGGPSPRQALLLETLAELTVVGLEIVQARVLEHAAVVVAEAQRRQLEDLWRRARRSAVTSRWTRCSTRSQGR